MASRRSGRKSCHTTVSSRINTPPSRHRQQTPRSVDQRSNISSESDQEQLLPDIDFTVEETRPAPTQVYHESDWRNTPSPQPEQRQTAQTNEGAGLNISQSHLGACVDRHGRRCLSPFANMRRHLQSTGTGFSGRRAYPKHVRFPEQLQYYHNILDRPSQPRVPARTHKQRALLKMRNIAWCQDVKRPDMSKFSAGAVVGRLRLGEELKGRKIVDWQVLIAVYPGFDDNLLEVRLAVEIVEGQASPYNLDKIRQIRERVVAHPGLPANIDNSTDFGVSILRSKAQVDLADWVVDIMKMYKKQETWTRKLNRLFREHTNEGPGVFPSSPVWTGQGSSYFGSHC